MKVDTHVYVDEDLMKRVRKALIDPKTNKQGSFTDAVETSLRLFLDPPASAIAETLAAVLSAKQMDYLKHTAKKVIVGLYFDGKSKATGMVQLYVNNVLRMECDAYSLQTTEGHYLFVPTPAPVSQGDSVIVQLAGGAKAKNEWSVGVVWQDLWIEYVDPGHRFTFTRCWQQLPDAAHSEDEESTIIAEVRNLLLEHHLDFIPPAIRGRPDSELPQEDIIAMGLKALQWLFLERDSLQQFLQQEWDSPEDWHRD